MNEVASHLGSLLTNPASQMPKSVFLSKLSYEHPAKPVFLFLAKDCYFNRISSIVDFCKVCKVYLGRLGRTSLAFYVSGAAAVIHLSNARELWHIPSRSLEDARGEEIALLRFKEDIAIHGIICFPS